MISTVQNEYLHNSAATTTCILSWALLQLSGSADWTNHKIGLMGTVGMMALPVTEYLCLESSVMTAGLFFIHFTELEQEMQSSAQKFTMSDLDPKFWDGYEMLKWYALAASFVDGKSVQRQMASFA